MSLSKTAFRLPGLAALALPLALGLESASHFSYPSPAPGSGAVTASRCIFGPRDSADPELVTLRPTQAQPGAAGTMQLVMPGSPFGVTVVQDGRMAYVVTITVERMRRRDGRFYVAWAATPELDEVVRLGVLGEDGSATGSVAWNKFLAFVSEEMTPEPERWSDTILLSGFSPSSRMHTMAGHGIFEDVDCTIY